MRHRHLPSLARAGLLLAAATSCVPQPRAARDALLDLLDYCAAGACAGLVAHRAAFGSA